MDPKERALGALTPILHHVGDSALATLAERRTPEALLGLVEDAWRFAEATTNDARARTEPAKLRLPVCAAGCDTCCHIHFVLASVPEVLALAQHLRATRTPDELARVAAAVSTRAAELAPMTIDERAGAKVPCALLVDGACSAHLARPLNCRGFNSCDADKCRTAYERGDAKMPLPVELTQFATCRNVSLGLMTGTWAAGLDPGPYELMGALAIALREDDAEARWLAGERVFDDAETRVGREMRATFAETFKRESAELVGAARWGGDVTPVRPPPPTPEEAKRLAHAARNKRKKEKRAR